LFLSHGGERSARCLEKEREEWLEL
jgi:hypothetical protein